MDHLQAIRIFVRVVETGSFNQAAQSLQVPSTTASKWVKALEEHLGVMLLQRTTRRVNVTEEGAAYYEHTRNLLSELDNIESSLSPSRSQLRGVLRIDTGAAVASKVLIPALAGFRAQYPQLKLRISASDRISNLVAENIDCAIRMVAHDPDLVSVPLGALPWSTCASPAWLAEHGTPLHPQELVDKQMPISGYFSWSTGKSLQMAFSKAGKSVTLQDLNYAVEISDSYAQLDAAIAGLGLIHTLDFMVRPAIDQGLLIPVLSDWRPSAVPVYLAYPPSRRYNTKVKAFVEWAQSIFADLVEAPGTP
jgi:DNA-binding transcriptional LysR family regulator